MCLEPQIVINPHYKKLCKNIACNGTDLKSVAYALYGHRPDFYIKVPCGRCRSCLAKRANDWLFRLVAEHDHSIDLGYVPYTIDFDCAPEYYEEFCSNPSKYIRLFTDNCRKRLGRSLRYFIVSEHGDKNGRLHLHGVLFNVKSSDLYDFLDCWRIGRVNARMIYDNCAYDYRVKYMFKDFFAGKKSRELFRPSFKKYTPEQYAARPGRVWCSPGLGRCFVDDPDRQHEFIHDDYITCVCRDYKGRLRYLPRYLRDKLFNELQLGQLKQAYFDTMFDHPFSNGFTFNGKKFNTLDQLYSIRDSFCLKEYPVFIEYVYTCPDFLFDHLSYYHGSDYAERCMFNLLNYS